MSGMLTSCNSRILHIIYYEDLLVRFFQIILNGILCCFAYLIAQEFFEALITKSLHSSNASFSILVTESGIVMLFRFVQPQNALRPILVTLSGMVIFVRFVQPLNARNLIFFTLSGMVILVRLVQP